jgi:hypothetical protein
LEKGCRPGINIGLTVSGERWPDVLLGRRGGCW